MVLLVPTLYVSTLVVLTSEKELDCATAAKEAAAAIPPRRNRKAQRDYDKQLYKERNLSERFIHRIKQCRRIFTRYDKSAQRYIAFLHLAATIIWLC